MKKLGCLLFAALLLFAGCAAAEDTVSVAIHDGLQFTFVVPDGYTFAEEWYGGILYADFEPQQDSGASMILSVGFSEEYANRSIGDLSDEELSALTEVTVADFSAPTLTVEETAHGTKLLVADENSQYDEYAEITTVYEGYFITMLVQPQNAETQLTQEQLQTAIGVISDMAFVHNEV